MRLGTLHHGVPGADSAGTVELEKERLQEQAAKIEAGGDCPATEQWDYAW